MITSAKTDKLLDEIFALYRDNPVRGTIASFERYIRRREVLESHLLDSLIEDYREAARIQNKKNGIVFKTKKK